MKLSGLPFVFLALSLGATKLAAQPHVHGQGALLVAQEDDVWQVEVRLPAADALGFEHEAQTQAEQQARAALIQRLESGEQSIKLHGQCTRFSVSHSLAANSEGNDHEHKSDDHEHDHGHATERVHQDSHQDITAQYQFRCKGEVTAIQIMLFESMPSLSVIQAQWVTEQGQGTQQLQAASPVLKW